jgi:hypothetical protein
MWVERNEIRQVFWQVSKGPYKKDTKINRYLCIMLQMFWNIW